MKTIGGDKQKKDLDYSLSDENKSEDKAPHRRSYWVERTRKKLSPNQDGEPYNFGHINGITSDWSVSKIKQLFHRCEKADIPFAPLWWKKYNDE